MVDSYGLCALVLDRASAAEEFTLRAGSAVTLTLPGPPSGPQFGTITSD